jgi:hypothetical protein
LGCCCYFWVVVVFSDVVVVVVVFLMLLLLLLPSLLMLLFVCLFVSLFFVLVVYNDPNYLCSVFGSKTIISICIKISLRGCPYCYYLCVLKKSLGCVINYTRLKCAHGCKDTNNLCNSKLQLDTASVFNPTL